MEEDIQKAQEVQNKTAIGSIADSIESRIFTIRGKQVMIDRDLAELYGVETKALNQAVKRNITRFPERFRFQLQQEEVEEVVTKCYHLAPLRFSHVLPYAFTEQGVSMLATILKSDIAAEVSIQIMDAFVSMRHYIISNSGMLQRIESLESWKLKTTEQVDAILDRMQVLEPKQPQEQLFQNGCVFDAWTYVSSLITSAKQEIILVDNYAHESVLALFAKRADGVPATIHTRYTMKFITDLSKFNEQYPDKAVKYIQLSHKNHDRFLIIDNDVYLLGASLKDLGDTWGAIIKMNETKKADILNNLS